MNSDHRLERGQTTVRIGEHRFVSGGNLMAIPRKRNKYGDGFEGVPEKGVFKAGDKGKLEDIGDRGSKRGGWTVEASPPSADNLLDSPQSMLLTSDQNLVMRMPNFGSFMDQQNNLQALLVDIHEDPEGFTSFVKYRRQSFSALGKAEIMALSSGDLSDYENLKQIGHGRFSSVFYAETKMTRMPRAIKRIQLADIEDDTLHFQQHTNNNNRKRAQRPRGTRHDTGAGSTDVSHGSDHGEAHGRRKKAASNNGKMTYDQCLKEVGLLKDLTNPNIVKLDTCFLDKNVLWVVMEWVDGGDLKGVISRTKRARERLPELTVWCYFTQICDALLYMHSRRIMHRDLKPANILVCMDGTVKLGDLGLGRYLNPQSAMAMSQVGTPLYMSPETLMGRGYELVSDIWSLGCVLYELAMLTSPFAARHLTLNKLFDKIVRADYLPVDRNIYSERLSNLVEHLLLPDPSVRPKIDMVQPASHLAMQAQRNGVEGLNKNQLAQCAHQLYPKHKMGGPEAWKMSSVTAEVPVLETSAPHEVYPSADDGNHGGGSHASFWPSTPKEASSAGLGVLPENQAEDDSGSPQGLDDGLHHADPDPKDPTEGNKGCYPNPPSPSGYGGGPMPSPNNTPDSSAQHPKMDTFWGESGDAGGGMNCGLADSTFSKSDVGHGTYLKRSFGGNCAEKCRRRSFSGCEIEAT